ncbi:MAG: class I SAM-dependent methyltransferase [Alphaproteobacteria bacterium]|nr:class I SAM-dependent methyltransferase [Alphaproteobacteria bacterium]
MGKGTIYPFILEYLLRQVRGDTRVLETGCGAALYRGPLSEAGAHYVGTDVENDHYQSPGDVDVYCSADSLPFPDESFDVVFNQGAIDYMPQPQRVLDEAWRVLKPGGVFLIFTYEPRVLLEIHENCMKSQRAWERAHWVFESSELISMLNASGFKSRDVSGELNTWQPDGFLNMAIAMTTGSLSKKRLANSHWRAFLGTKKSARWWR